MSITTKREKWLNKKNRISYKIKKNIKHPRLLVFRSNRNISIQLIDNQTSNIICSSSSLDKSVNKDVKNAKNKIDLSKIVAEDIASKLKAKKVKTVVFDRNGYPYHGRVKTIAETLRENGISL